MRHEQWSARDGYARDQRPYGNRLEAFDTPARPERWGRPARKSGPAPKLAPARGATPWLQQSA